MKNTLTVIFLILSFATATLASTTITLRPGPIDGEDVQLLKRTPDAVMDLNVDPYESNTTYTWTHLGQLSLKRFFIGFDFSQIPANASIQSALLSFYYNPTDDSEGFDYHTGNNSAYIERVIEPWEKNTITWNNQAAVTAVNRVSLAASTSQTQDYLDINVTQLVQDMLNDPNGAHGFRVRMQDEVNYYKSLIFASSRHPNESLRPKLIIEYSLSDSDDDNNITPNPGETCLTLKPDHITGKDVQVLMRLPDSTLNSYESNTIYTWTHLGNLSVKRTYIDFDFTQIPANAVIQSAHLSLFYNASDNSENFDYHTGNNNAYIERVVEPWTINSPTWNNQPAVSTTNRISLPASYSPIQNYTHVNVTQLVQDMFNDPDGVHGFRIKMQDETTPYKSLLFASSRHSNENLRPTLSVCFSIPFLPITMPPKLFPNPLSNILDIDFNDSENKIFNIEIYNSNGSLVYSKKTNPNETTGSKKISLDISDLLNGTYQVLVIDNSNKYSYRILKTN